jgi:hypothetical protein
MLFKIFNYDDMMDVVTANLYEKMILESVRKYLCRECRDSSRICWKTETSGEKIHCQI